MATLWALEVHTTTFGQGKPHLAHGTVCKYTNNVMNGGETTQKILNVPKHFAGRITWLNKHSGLRLHEIFFI